MSLSNESAAPTSGVAGHRDALRLRLSEPTLCTSATSIGASSGGVISAGAGSAVRQLHAAAAALAATQPVGGSQGSQGSQGSEDSDDDAPHHALLLAQHSDTRTHVVVELYETERSYVESLRTLVTKYHQPLKSPENAGLVDASLVDEIFYQVPAILEHHEGFLDELRKRLEHWDVRQKVGDVFVNAFTKASVIDMYTAFINNWKTAKEAIKNTCQTKPAFARFLEAMAREHKGKLALDSLLIMPVQRIPRYELLIQTLLKHTEPLHPDHEPLLTAQKAVHDLAVKINCTEREGLEAEQQLQALRDLEALIEGCDLVNGEGGRGRVLIRHDLVTLATVAAGGAGTASTAATSTGKERILFLFTDLLIIARIKRRSGTIRKPSGTGSGAGFAGGLEANKYRTSMRVPLDELELVKCKDESVRRVLREMQRLSEDVATLTQMCELASGLHAPHQPLDDLVRDMLATATRQLADRHNSDQQLACLELTLSTSSGVKNITVIFRKADNRSSWEKSFNDAKQRLALSADRRPAPKLVTSVPIRKTRAGLQFTCAAPTIPAPNPTSVSSSSGTTNPASGSGAGAGAGAGASAGARDVWVCNSDGYVGQVCVLSLLPEPNVTSCNGVCNARILCVASIPASSAGWSSNIVSADQSTCPNNKTNISISVEDADENTANIQLDSSSSSDEEEEAGESKSCTSSSNPAPPTEETQPTEASEATTTTSSTSVTAVAAAVPPTTPTPTPTPTSPSPVPEPCGSGSGSSALTNPAVSASAAATTPLSTPVVPAGGSGGGGVVSGGGAPVEDNVSQPTMWLGTEDGYIHVYSCCDNIRIKRNKTKIQPGAAVHCIIYLDNRVFVALANGDIAIYSRDQAGGWNTLNPATVTVGTVTTPVTKMVPVANRLWCSCQHTVKILNTATLQIENTVTASGESSRAVTCLVTSGLSVWLAIQNSAVLKLYHANSFDHLGDVNVAPAVSKMLASCDDIIRQHKSACLRVTSLLACKDLLWVGTSAGVLLTMPLPHVTSSTLRLSSAPIVTGVPHGHTGHVRFLTVVEAASQLERSTSQSSRSHQKTKSESSSSPVTPKLLVISGGDGYEDFRSSGVSEVAGKEDSTNHLLLWQV